jgi:hypothetical protein
MTRPTRLYGSIILRPAPPVEHRAGIVDAGGAQFMDLGAIGAVVEDTQVRFWDEAGGKPASWTGRK